MTRSKLILLALLFAVSARADEFADAARLYDAGKFTEARNAYDALVHDGKYGANLFYDLGNTWFRLDEPGRAILNYERALALEPSHPEARANLAFVREKTGAQIPPRTWLDYLAAPFNINIFAVGAAIAAWIVVFAILGLRMSRRPSPLLWFVLAAAVFVLGAAGAGIAVFERDKSLAVVTDKQVEARLEPLDNSAPAGTLASGGEVKILSDRGPWLYCALSDNSRAWLPSKSVELVRLAR